eukprot:16178687-Heterocapsa_arctica.AAC.1
MSTKRNLGSVIMSSVTGAVFSFEQQVPAGEDLRQVYEHHNEVHRHDAQLQDLDLSRLARLPE